MKILTIEGEFEGLDKDYNEELPISCVLFKKDIIDIVGRVNNLLDSQAYKPDLRMSFQIFSDIYRVRRKTRHRGKNIEDLEKFFHDDLPPVLSNLSLEWKIGCYNPWSGLLSTHNQIVNINFSSSENTLFIKAPESDLYARIKNIVFTIIENNSNQNRILSKMTIISIGLLLSLPLFWAMS